MAGVVVAILLFSFSSLWAQTTPEEQGKKKETVAETSQPSLAELARRERARRAGSQKAVRVITNGDLRRMGRARIGTSIAPAPHAEEETGPAKTASETEEGKPVEKDTTELDTWKSAFQEVRSLLENAVNRYMVLQLRMNNVQNSYYREADGTTKQMLQKQMAETMEELKLSEQTLTEARARLADLVEQAKQAGVLPGEIRDLVGKLPESASITEITPQ